MVYSAANHARPLHYLQSRRNLPPMGMLALRIAVVLTKWDQRRRTRKALYNLSNSDLKDIGLTRDQANTEAGRPFWRV